MATSKFYDYATGKEVHNNPEEEYRQLFEHILIDDLGYPKSHIDIEVILAAIRETTLTRVLKVWSSTLALKFSKSGHLI